MLRTMNLSLETIVLLCSFIQKGIGSYSELPESDVIRLTESVFLYDFTDSERTDMLVDAMIEFSTKEKYRKELDVFIKAILCDSISLHELITSNFRRIFVECICHNARYFIERIMDDYIFWVRIEDNQFLNRMVDDSLSEKKRDFDEIMRRQSGGDIYGRLS